MKILFLSDNFPPESKGGAEIVAFNLAKALQKRGHFIYVITATQDKNQTGEVNFEGLRIFKIFSNYHERWRAYLSLYNLQTVGKVKEILQKIRPDIVHSHNIHYHLSYYCLKLAKKIGAKVFLTAHDAMAIHYGKWIPKNPQDFKIKILDQIREAKKRYNPLRNFIIRYYLKYVDKIFAVSNSLKTLLEANGIKNIETIYNGINIDEWKENPEEIRKFKEKYNLFGKKVIFFGGRISKLKGGEKIIQTLSKIKKEIPGIVLLVAGKKEGFGQKMEELSREIGVGDDVIFTGWLGQEDLRSSYYSSDLIVSPSIYFDPFPIINLEAMACKKPIVGTCFGGSPEIIVDGKTGYIVNPSNTDLLAEKIIDLLKNPQKAKRFGKTGYERVKKLFSLDSQVNKIISHYQSIVDKEKL